MHPGGGRTLLVLVHGGRANRKADGALVPHGKQRVAHASNDVLRKLRLTDALGDGL